MDPELKFKKTFSENADREKVKFKKQLFIYLFFLFISILFWYLNALSKTYSTQLSYSVNYEGYPKGKVLISGKSTNLNIQVSGNGFHLLRFKILSFFSPVNLDLNEFSSRIMPTSSLYKYVLPTNTIHNKFSFLFNNAQVNSIKPDSLYFLFTEVIDKKIAIKPIINLDFEKPYLLKGSIHVIPDSIIVSGPKAIIDTLKYISTKYLEIKGINKKIVVDAELNPINHFIFPLQKVKILIPAEKFTEVVYTIPIESENTPNGYEIKTFPATINLSFNVAISDFDKINSYLFRAAVDYNSILESHPKKLKVFLLKSPSMAKNIKFNPKSVDYIVE